MDFATCPAPHIRQEREVDFDESTARPEANTRRGREGRRSCPDKRSAPPKRLSGKLDLSQVPGYEGKTAAPETPTPKKATRHPRQVPRQSPNSPLAFNQRPARSPNPSRMTMSPLSAPRLDHESTFSPEDLQGAPSLVKAKETKATQRRQDSARTCLLSSNVLTFNQQYSITIKSLSGSRATSTQSVQSDIPFLSNGIRSRGSSGQLEMRLSNNIALPPPVRDRDNRLAICERAQLSLDPPNLVSETASEASLPESEMWRGARSVGLGHGARCLAPMGQGIGEQDDRVGYNKERDTGAAPTNLSQFMVGTGTVRKLSHNALIRLKDDEARVDGTLDGARTHGGIPLEAGSDPADLRQDIHVERFGSPAGAEVWSAAESDGKIVAALRSGTSTSFAVLKWPGSQLSSSELRITDVSELDRAQHGVALHVDVSPTMRHRALAASSQSLCLLDLGQAGLSPLFVGIELLDMCKDSNRCGPARWCSDTPNVFVMALGKHGLAIGDSRTPTTVVHTWLAHALGTRCAEFGPFSDKALSSVGDDGTLRCWDLRRFAANADSSRSAEPTAHVHAHEHSACALRYNSQFGGVLATSGTDGVVRVWLTDALHTSSTQPTSGETDRTKAKCTFPDHDDTVYDIAWSRQDPLSLASLSYDGRFCLRRLPESVCNEILLA
ncbi:Protein TSSC1 [Porphyridium purpureum]|uniref:Protein TSSC1 n=1 Tax=Porphyridium purpureum TaxID=35688 RepID=A0A5J4YYM7_PORPP|nr:Protein TSSC1 [Porphyridium purpureum]|eukprot:POR5314..scf209_3